MGVHFVGGPTIGLPRILELDNQFLLLLHVITRYRSPNQNLRTRLLKVITRLFHNLRATRQTELAAEHPLHVVCEWIGNSKLIAQEHYLRVTEADFEKAQQNAQQSSAVQGMSG